MNITECFFKFSVFRTCAENELFSAHLCGKWVKKTKWTMHKTATVVRKKQEKLRKFTLHICRSSVRNQKKSSIRLDRTLNLSFLSWKTLFLSTQKILCNYWWLFTHMDISQHIEAILRSKTAFFKRAWQMVKVLSLPWALGFKSELIRPLKLGTLGSRIPGGSKNTSRQSFIFFSSNFDSLYF